ncbi:hypothetical protein [Haliangium sp.]|uniref:hypothetical protein n=1 Tax=Haliangium sp. TaxID=2663208 RepID=UPI003D0B719A
MVDWLGSIRMRESSPRRVVLSLSKGTLVTGWGLVLAGAGLAYLGWSVSLWLVLGAVAVALMGALLGTLRRRLVFDRAAGVLETTQGAFGLYRHAIVPLFHLRAVVIVARRQPGAVGALLSNARYLAYVDRRVGEPVYLDEARRCADLLPMAEAIAELAELRLEYDAMSRAAGDV